MEFNTNLVLYIVAYLVGGIPFGYLLGKYAGGVDVTSEGSGNIGATNVLRVLKQRDPKLAKKLGAATLFLDAVKGMVVIGIAYMLNAPSSVLWTIAVLAVIGHCFSPFMGFEGGKGVATGVGVLLVLLPAPTLMAIAAWFASIKTIRVSSASSMVALITLIIASYLLYPDGINGIDSHAPLWIISFIVFYKHIPNLVRLVKKEEAQVV